MCSSPKTPKIEPPPPPAPPPIVTAKELREPNSATRDSGSLAKKRKGRNALLIVREPTSTNIPSAGSGVNA